MTSWHSCILKCATETYCIVPCYEIDYVIPVIPDCLCYTGTVLNNLHIQYQVNTAVHRWYGIGIIELEWLDCWCTIAITTKWYQSHANDKCDFLLMLLIIDKYTFRQWYLSKNTYQCSESHHFLKLWQSNMICTQHGMPSLSTTSKKIRMRRVYNTEASATLSCHIHIFFNCLPHHDLQRHDFNGKCLVASRVLRLARALA